MHILVLPSWYTYPGHPINGIFFREQALALHRAGFQVGVVAPILKSMKEICAVGCLNRAGTTYWEDDGGVATLRGENWSIPKLPQVNMSRWLSCGKRLISQYIAMRGRPDIVHAHSILYAGVLAVEIKAIHGIPYLITEHSTAFSRGLIRAWQEPYIRTAICESSLRVAVSQKLVQLLNSRFRVPDAGWDYLPNMVDVDFFSIGQDISNIAGRRFAFFSAAFLTPKKGMNFLIEAFAGEFAEEEIELWIGGEGEEKKRLEEQAKLLGVEKQISFYGALNRVQIRSMMQNCDAFVLPSLYETFGVVIIEALATGKPVVATRCGGPESIINGRNGLLVPVADPDELGRAMRQIVDSIGGFDKNVIRSDCVSKFGAQAVVGELERRYNIMLGKKS